jgi:hypothetical protein
MQYLSWVVVFQCRWTCNHGDGDVRAGGRAPHPPPFQLCFGGTLAWEKTYYAELLCFSR